MPKSLTEVLDEREHLHLPELKSEFLLLKPLSCFRRNKHALLLQLLELVHALLKLLRERRLLIGGFLCPLIGSTLGLTLIALCNLTNKNRLCIGRRKVQWKAK